MFQRQVLNNPASLELLVEQKKFLNDSLKELQTLKQRFQETCPQHVEHLISKKTKQLKSIENRINMRKKHARDDKDILLLAKSLDSVNEKKTTTTNSNFKKTSR